MTDTQKPGAVAPPPQIISVGDENELREAIGNAVADRTPLQVVAAGSRRHLGRPVETGHVLDISALSGITLYEPEELVLTAKAATPLAEIVKATAGAGQMLAFDPPLRHAFGKTMAEEKTRKESAGDSVRGTLGGIIAANLSGPRRLSAGAARDYILGCKCISGRGEAFQSGGRVVKNVTGYDLSKLMAGSYGTLGVMHEITLKTMPLYETALMLLCAFDDAGAAGAWLRDALAGPHDIASAAILPQAATARSSSKQLANLGNGRGGQVVAAIRLEGIAASVEARRDALVAMQKDSGRQPVIIKAAMADTITAEIRDLALLDHHANRMTWKITCPPAAGPALLETLTARSGCGGFADWGGGLLWLTCPMLTPGGLTAIRDAAHAAGGEAMLYDAPADLRKKTPPFAPAPPARAALEKRIKAAFDPLGILNPGRIREEA